MRGRRDRSGNAPAREEGGWSLVELMLAMALLAVAITAVEVTINAVSNEQVVVNGEFSALDSAQVAEETVSRDAHAAMAPSATATAFTVATSTHATFTASLGDVNGPTQVDILVTPVGSLATLTVTVTPATAGTSPNYTYTGKPEVHVTTSLDLSKGPVLSYFDSSGSALTAPVATLSSIESMGLQLVVRDGKGSVTLTQRIALLNVSYAQASN